MTQSRALVISSVLLALLGGLQVPTEASQPMRIGTSVGLTGAYALLGQTVQRGYQLCVSQANDQGGVLGRKIELTVEDDRSNVAPAVAIYEKFIERDKVDAVFGERPMLDHPDSAASSGRLTCGLVSAGAIPLMRNSVLALPAFGVTSARDSTGRLRLGLTQSHHTIGAFDGFPGGSDGVIFRVH